MAAQHTLNTEVIKKQKKPRKCLTQEEESHYVPKCSPSLFFVPELHQAALWREEGKEAPFQLCAHQKGLDPAVCRTGTPGGWSGSSRPTTGLSGWAIRFFLSVSSRWPALTNLLIYFWVLETKPKAWSRLSTCSTTEPRPSPLPIYLKHSPLPAR